jgi:hypothetical protein
VVLVVILIAGAVWWTFFRGPSSADCAPVRELLTYNKTQIDEMNARTVIPEGASEPTSEPSELDYRTWVDGLTDRADKVTAPELAGPSKDLAQTAERLIRARTDLEAQRQTVAPGGPTPPAAMVVTGLNAQFNAQVGQLANACA